MVIKKSTQQDCYISFQRDNITWEYMQQIAIKIIWQSVNVKSTNEQCSQSKTNLKSLLVVTTWSIKEDISLNVFPLNV